MLWRIGGDFGLRGFGGFGFVAWRFKGLKCRFAWFCGFVYVGEKFRLFRFGTRFNAFFANLLLDSPNSHFLFCPSLNQCARVAVDC